MSASQFLHHLRRGTLTLACGRRLPSLPTDVCNLISQWHNCEIQRMWKIGQVTNVMRIDLRYALWLSRCKIRKSLHLSLQLWCKSHPVARHLYNCHNRWLDVDIDHILHNAYNPDGADADWDDQAATAFDVLRHSCDSQRPKRLILMQPLLKPEPRACDYVQNFEFDGEAMRYITRTLATFESAAELILATERFSNKRAWSCLRKALNAAVAQVKAAKRVMATCNPPPKLVYDPEMGTWKKQRAL